MKNKIGIKTLIISASIIVITSFLLTINFVYTLKDQSDDRIEEKSIEKYAKYNYQVYLDGEKIGIIDSEKDLYDLINEEQTEIKKRYNVEYVYPPKGFNIVKTKSYTNQTSTVEDIYNTIKSKKEFTIKGYKITVKKVDSEDEPHYIYVLDENIFYNAANNVVNTFVGEERFVQYKEGTQPEIKETGYIIENMEFQDNISIKESYISADEKIYTDEVELTQYLMFGDNISSKEYIVSQGDTVASIAEANKLNVDELLIANTNLKGADSLLSIGQKLNVALINPILSLGYNEIVVDDVEIRYETTYENDNTKYVDYRATKVKGVNGIQRVKTRVNVLNGTTLQGGDILGSTVIRAVQNEVIVKGTKPYVSGPQYQPTDSGTIGAWPTLQPYHITQGYQYYGGYFHEGIDISGTGYGSPIYAVLEGEVISSQNGGMMGSNSGLNIVIKHPNGYYSVYAHCSSLYVKKGDFVTRGQRIAAMGNTGMVSPKPTAANRTAGTHLHFGLYYGVPNNGGRHANPYLLWR